MGWKSTIDITRSEALRLISKKILTVNDLTNEDLADMVESLGYGDDTGDVYFGHNFIVVDDDKIK